MKAWPSISATAFWRAPEMCCRTCVSKSWTCSATIMGGLGSLTRFSAMASCITWSCAWTTWRIAFLDKLRRRQGTFCCPVYPQRSRAPSLRSNPRSRPPRRRGVSRSRIPHIALTEEVLKLLRAAGLEHVPLIVGGIVPPADVGRLKAAGVAAVYTPKDFEINSILRAVVQEVEARFDAQRMVRE
jgi:hypothetical protein